jgi:hypothetical protein
MCSRERIILRAAKALARSPAARCIDPDAAMPWLPFTADAQVIRTKSLDEPLRDIEARELRRYVTELERIVGRTLEPVREIVAGWRGTPEALVERVREEVTRLRGDMAKEIAAVARPYAAVMADAGARAGLAALPQSIPAVADMVEFGQANPLAVRAAESTAIRMANTVAQTTARNVAEHVAEGIRTGETIDEMAEWIADEGFSESRATMIGPRAPTPTPKGASRRGKRRASCRASSGSCRPTLASSARRPRATSPRSRSGSTTPSTPRTAFSRARTGDK